VPRWAHYKLHPLRYGSYTITKAVGDNSFELNIPPFLGLHPVFNVDHLRPYLANSFTKASGSPGTKFSRSFLTSWRNSTKWVLRLFRHLSEQNRGSCKLIWVCCMTIVTKRVREQNIKEQLRIKLRNTITTKLMNIET
jgi:hypothetical protein